MAHENDIKPCPFCGAGPHDTHPPVVKDIGTPLTGRFLAVVCNNCNSAGDNAKVNISNMYPVEDAKAEAIELWNRRVDA